MDALNAVLAVINGILWHDYVLYTVLATGLLFTIWSRFSQFRSVTHGTATVLGKYSGQGGEGALSHFQALSAALSATVGLGNIGGVAIAVALGGPGAVFWMWAVGFFGMALKSAEVTLAMLYRNTDDPDNPHGGAMYVVSRAIAEKNPSLAWLGKALGALFCVTVITFAFTGGNMFQAWNVGEITNEYFGVPWWVSGVLLATVVAAVILGGIKRIGSVAGTIVPVMCCIYVICGLFVLLMNAAEIPAMLALIFQSAFSSTEASGAFMGGTVGYAFLLGMKRALFSSEAGLGSAPMAHAAVKTREPVREGVVAGLEPLIDTLVVCTITALILLSTGVWNRDALHSLPTPVVSSSDEGWTLSPSPLPATTELTADDRVFLIANGEKNEDTGNSLIKVYGDVEEASNGKLTIDWDIIKTKTAPELNQGGVYEAFVGASLTAKAFDSAYSGLGKWMVTLAVWLFAISTMISWSYYGEQGMVYLFGEHSVLPYRVVFCLSAVASCLFLTKLGNSALDSISALGAGLMMVVNIPITLWLGSKAMKAYHGYINRLKAGEFE